MSVVLEIRCSAIEKTELDTTMAHHAASPAAEPHELMYFSKPSLSSTGIGSDADDSAADCPVQFVAPSGRMSLGVPLEARQRSAAGDAAPEDPMMRFGQIVVVSWDEPNVNERHDRQRITAKIVLVMVANVLITTWIVNGDIQVRAAVVAVDPRVDQPADERGSRNFEPRIPELTTTFRPLQDTSKVEVTESGAFATGGADDGMPSPFAYYDPHAQPTSSDVRLQYTLVLAIGAVGLLGALLESLAALNLYILMVLVNFFVMG